MNIGPVLIGIGIGAIAAAIYSYKTKKDQGLIPTKYGIWIGIAALIAGLLITYDLI